MVSKRASLASIVVLLAASGCVAGVGTDADGSDNNDAGSSAGAGSSEGGSMGTGFGDTGGGQTQGCSTPDCLDPAQQGNCDTGLAIDSADAMDGARAIGICQAYTEGGWGVKQAAWVRSDGQPLTDTLLLGKGILDNFGGLTPREGATMLSISSGAARAPDDPDFQGAGVSSFTKGDGFTPHGSPPGYPKESPACPNVTTGEPYDSAGLRLVIKTPSNAKSFSYDFDFHTFEFPVYICTTWNDFFVAMLSPKVSTLPDGNISFDAQGNTISVNAGFLQVCTPQTAGGKVFDCPMGPGELNGTNFEGHAATSWLQTSAPIEAPGGEITLDFLIWDSGDTAMDSTTLIDNFRFELDETVTGTQPVPE